MLRQIRSQLWTVCSDTKPKSKKLVERLERAYTQANFDPDIECPEGSWSLDQAEVLDAIRRLICSERDLPILTHDEIEAKYRQEDQRDE